MPSAGGTLADGRYTLEERLGAGGMATVWLAIDDRLHRRVAVKVMSDVLAGDEQWLARFHREARAAASLSHPNIVKVFDFGVEEGRPYIVMAHVPGGSLKERLAEGDPPEPAGLARELLGALAHVHAAGILHRDVKPGNILIDADGRSHLTDFGIARPDDATTVTQTGVVLGTMRYLAPEVASGGRASERSDLYSAGCVLREAGADGAGGHLAELVEALIADDPERRPTSAAEALRRLDGEPADAETAETRVMGETTAQTRVLDAAEQLKAAAGRARPAAEQLKGRARPAAEQLRVTASHARRSPWFAPATALAAIAIAAIVVVALAAGGDGDNGSSSAPRAAPASAPLEEQLDALDRMIEGAAR